VAVYEPYKERPFLPDDCVRSVITRESVKVEVDAGGAASYVLNIEDAAADRVIVRATRSAGGRTEEFVLGDKKSE
jgi:hypothetical protein